MKGLKKIAGKSKEMQGYYGPLYLKVYYNRETEEAHYHEYCDWSKGWSAIHEDKNIIECGIIYEKKTMKEIRRMIEERLEYLEEKENFWRSYLESLE